MGYPNYEEAEAARNFRKEFRERFKDFDGEEAVILWLKTRL
jgi:hypothetical protein